MEFQSTIIRLRNLFFIIVRFQGPLTQISDTTFTKCYLL